MSRSQVLRLCSPARIRFLVAMMVAVLFAARVHAAADRTDAFPASFQIIEPVSIPQGAAVPQLRLHALDRAGQKMTSWSGNVSIQGLNANSSADATESPEPLNAEFDGGELVLTPSSTGLDNLHISKDGLQLTVGEQLVRVEPPQQLSHWWRILPPLLAIVLAVWLREVNIALLLATFSGALIYSGFHDLFGAINILCDVLVRQIADSDHASIILFTVLLGATIGLMNDSGGTQAVVNRIAKFAGTRRRGQILTWLMGMVVFFDDYANTMLIGGAMRPLSDRLRISREKLAFLIDSTAAPIAGVALVSTWVGFEIDQIKTGLLNAGMELSGQAADQAAQNVFLWSIPFRAYPLLMIAFVGAIATSGRDFGSMLRAECRAAGSTVNDDTEAVCVTGSPWFAILPVLTLIATVVTCYLNDVDAYRMLLLAALSAALVAFVLPVIGRTMAFEQVGTSLTRGVISMVPAIIVLVLAWAVSDVCRPDKLDTAGFVISMVGDAVSPILLPATAFLVASVISISIGSSFTTMALLTPVFIPLCWSALSGNNSVDPTLAHPIFLGTVGAILGGSIFGDHCSPISDTTI
ncbi:MAG: hypothetical protein KDA85_05725, partial [Planctomycetaceae bacterium]|nr:hypothetical protein [Planctomycetaceae bacterium]